MGATYAPQAQGNGSSRLVHSPGATLEGTWLADSRWASEEEKIVTVKAGQTEHVELEVREGKMPVLITVLEPNGAPSVRATVIPSRAPAD